MNRSELDAFLRQHTLIEEYFQQNPNSSFDNIPHEELVKYLHPLKDFHFRPQATCVAQDIMDSFKHKGFSNVVPDEKVSFSIKSRFYASEAHRHPYVELVYVYSGRCTQTLNGHRITMEKGDICILDTNVEQGMDYCGEDDIIVNCGMWKSYFDSVFFTRLKKNDVLLNFFIHAFYKSKESQQYILFRSSGNEKIQWLMEHALCEYFDKSHYTEDNIHSYLSLIFSELLRIYEKDNQWGEFNQLVDNKLADIITYIQKNCRDVTLLDTAKHFSFNPSYLSRTLRKISGQGFNEILREAKLAKASLLLQYTSKPVEEIANEIGYANLTFFYQVFKKEYGSTPGDYRKRRL